MAVSSPPRLSVFVNCPFVESYERLFVALIAGLTSLALVPRCVLEVGTSADRLTIGSSPRSAVCPRGNARDAE